MIESVSLASYATFHASPEILDGLKQVNFVFGSNGTGKTTISRVIGNPVAYPNSNVNWTSDQPLQTLVYNRDFVSRNYEQSDELKGVFTLGEDEAEVRGRIDELVKKRRELKEERRGHLVNLEGDEGTGGKKSELAELEEWLTEKCWVQKLRLEGKLREAFRGYLNNKAAFKEKARSEASSNSARVMPLEDLEKRAETLFRKSPEEVGEIPGLDGEDLFACEDSDVFAKKIVGKEDVDIAGVIRALDNSDWVRKGQEYFDAELGDCPFCQQKTPEGFAESLAKFFDDAYRSDISRLENIENSYSKAAVAMNDLLDELADVPADFLDHEVLRAKGELLERIIEANKQKISAKRKEPSRLISLESSSSLIGAVSALAEAANGEIKEHNRLVKNLESEQELLRTEVWRFLLEEMTSDLDHYKSRSEGIQKAISGLQGKINKIDERISECSNELESLEKEVVSVQPTVDSINAILGSFGFGGFRLATTEDGLNYRLCRNDGSDAKESLSEGEKSFVAFLYFYNLIRGSHSESAVVGDRVVVFDDPVSSLDSEVLFVVSSLIHQVIDEVRGDDSPLQQVFVLTHNVYFHKEVTYDPQRGGGCRADETFWLVSKPDGRSSIKQCDKNPVQTSYQLLWEEVRQSEHGPSIQNTLRRILESYFKILGGVNIRKLCDKFEGDEKLVCRSLVSWVNDGSHGVLDDMFASRPDFQVAAYLSVFRQVFVNLNQLGHYQMMMGASLVGVDQAEELVEAG